MYIDRDAALRHDIAPLTFHVERGRLRFFAETTGLTDPVYLDVEAARRGGHPDLPVPPTFLSNALELEVPDPLGWLAELGADLSTTTHAEQGFTYHATAHAGDVLLLRRRIVDVYTKKDGALEFVVKQTSVERGDEVIADVRFVIVLKHREARR